ncbi:unnamed protein product [Chondrus crispus]|uniref:Rad4 beta-hairpin domain-containing protein n=1 Tax=Chondrus crispus TaxID=2769 RepID=R7QHI9_CHOCR|nr:unnamed protein product [Chondrus crispus]CDF37238.1 unnamed protein product [Chondrus crispus]|eukprot:XP_005717057.1 unnamed protein product [Chondrus crispus]
MSESQEKANSQQLRAAAVDGVTGAITRGRKRRSRQHDVPRNDIQIGPLTTAKPEQLAAPQRQLQNVSYHKRRRVSLIPGTEVEDEDDSNDEWEEDVHMDTDAVEAAVKLMTQDAEQKKKADDEATADDKGPEKEEPKKSAEEIAEEEKQARARKRAVAARKRKKLLRRHALHLLLSVATLFRLDGAANTDLVSGMALSMLPKDMFLRVESISEDLSRLGLWIRMTFKPTAMIQDLIYGDKVFSRRRLCSAAERAVACISRGAGDVMDIAVAIAALVRSQGFRCRIVIPLQPLQHKLSKATKAKGSGPGGATVVEVNPFNETEAILYSWLEVWCPADKRWIPLDIREGFLSEENPTEVLRKSISRVQCFAERVDLKPVKRDALATSPARRKSTRRTSKRLQTEHLDPVEVPRRALHPALFSHVVAIERGVITDVTWRYTRNSTEVSKARATGKVFEKVLQRFQDECPADADDEAYRLELDEFDALAANEPVPTTLTAFEKHRRYVLERHIKRYEVVHPKFPVIGHFNEEPIYLRSRVHLLHTKDRWIRQMREVMDDAKPMKVVKSKNGSDDTVDLFGKWQTMPLIIPECVDGKVPRNMRGNVDLWTPEHLPKGTVHIKSPFARGAARTLGVDFAPAMTGFELMRGRPVPKIEGIVIAEENEDMIRDAARSSAQVVRERQAKREEEEARAREEQAAREARARERVQRRYGGKG